MLISKMWSIHSDSSYPVIFGPQRIPPQKAEMKTSIIDIRSKSVKHEFWDVERVILWVPGLSTGWGTHVPKKWKVLLLRLIENQNNYQGCFGGYKKRGHEFFRRNPAKTKKGEDFFQPKIWWRLFRLNCSQNPDLGHGGHSPRKSLNILGFF